MLLGPSKCVAARGNEAAGRTDGRSALSICDFQRAAVPLAGIPTSPE